MRWQSLNTSHWIVQVTDAGLDSAEVKRRIDQYGYNKLPESTRNPFFVYLGYLWNPLSWAMEVAAILAIILLDYADFCLIIALLLVNATIRSGPNAHPPCLTSACPVPSLMLCIHRLALCSWQCHTRLCNRKVHICS